MKFAKIAENDAIGRHAGAFLLTGVVENEGGGGGGGGDDPRRRLPQGYEEPSFYTTELPFDADVPAVCHPAMIEAQLILANLSPKKKRGEGEGGGGMQRGERGSEERTPKKKFWGDIPHTPPPIDTWDALQTLKGPQAVKHPYELYTGRT